MNKTLTRADIDVILQALDEEIAGAPEGEELRAYYEGSQIFWDLAIDEPDRDYAIHRLGAIARKYELPVGTAT